MAESMASMAEKALRIKPSDDLGSDYHTYGSIESVNEDGSYQVRLDGASNATRCANTCTAYAGDRALVLVKSDGKCAVVGRVGGTAVESYAIAPGSATESFSAKVPYSPHKTSYAVVYYRCTYADTVGSVKFPITEGGSANVVLKDFMDVDDSMIVGCIENIAVALGNSPNKHFTVTRGKPFRFAIKASGNSINASPGPQFEITQVTLCGW